MLELLKAAAKVSIPSEDGALPPNILRFSLEYKNTPDLEDERKKLSELLGNDGFDFIQIFGEDDPNIVILQFFGVKRQHSPEFLFQNAEDLVDELGLLSCTPDIDPAWVDNEQALEGVGDFLWGLCTSKDKAPSNNKWAIELIKADKAWTLGSKGQGILIGQPDTGVAEHRELDEGLKKSLGYNFITNKPDPTDPLSKSMGSPGHGTGTSSAAISRKTHTVSGSAPGADLVPIRCLDSVIIGTGTAVARGIDHARKKGCNIITMSLGGPLEASGLRRAIKRAVDADMIVLAAAGNCVKIVTYPAWDKNVIAVAGINHKKKKWKGSSSGSKVDISAPGENVYVAKRQVVKPGQTPNPSELKEVNSRGQGTSFAVAITAGCAALWLSHHGVDKIKLAAAAKGVKVQELFRAALRQTAQPLASGNTYQLGAGIVDAQALLKLKLTDITLTAPVTSANPFLAFGEDFPGYERHVAESGFLALDRFIRGGNRAGALESAYAPRPSRQLAAQLKSGTLSAQEDFPAPAVINSPHTPSIPTNKALARIAAGRRGNVESASNYSIESARTAIKERGTQSIVDHVSKTLKNIAKETGNNIADNTLSQIEQEADIILDSAVQQTSTSFSDYDMNYGLEALVLLTGRPALLANNDGGINFQDPRVGDWANKLIPTRNNWKNSVKAVGRIDVEVDGKYHHVGTGFVMENGLVMTNRHVIDAFANPIPLPDGQQKFLLSFPVSIIFDALAKDKLQRFKIKAVVEAGASRIGRYVDLDKLDMAILEVETTNSHGGSLPTPISSDLVSTVDGDVTDILLTGYPAEPGNAAGIDPATGETSLEIWDRLHELYQGRYGLKYVSPGMIVSAAGDLAHDRKNWAFSYDATTLGGNSGSVVMSLGSQSKLCGLHFGGAPMTQNFAHDIKSVYDVGDRTFSPR